jgi:hypothetical protein
MQTKGIRFLMNRSCVHWLKNIFFVYYYIITYVSNEMSESVVVIKSSRKLLTMNQKFCSSRQYYNKISASRESNCDVVQLITLNEPLNYDTNNKMLSLHLQYHYSKKSPV